MTYVDSRPDALVFTGPKGGALRRAHCNNLTRWVETAKTLGAPGLDFHDLRHTGNHLAARAGATTKELMARIGHDDMRAALIYQHATDEADRRLAERLSGLVDEQRTASGRRRGAGRRARPGELIARGSHPDLRARTRRRPSLAGVPR